MIINDEDKFVFVHIPKCAGTSVRVALNKFDSAQGFFAHHRGFHPDLGHIDLGHIPLSVLREYYSDAYEKIRRYFSFTVMRDPYSRFASSLSQHLTMYGKNPFKNMNEKELQQAIDNAINYLSAHSAERCLSYKYIHFQSQHSYIFDQGAQQVKAIYDIKNVRTMFEDIERIVGETVFKENTGRIVHIGKAMLYRTAIIGYCVDIVSPLLSGPVLRLLPGRTKNFLRNIVYVSRDDKFSNLFEAEYVKEFISKYYAEDIKLYESLNKPSNSIIPNPSLI